MALEAALGVTVGLLVAGKVPDDQGLVATAREQHVGAIDGEKKTCQKPIVQYQPSPASNFFCSYFSREVAKLVTQPL